MSHRLLAWLADRNRQARKDDRGSVVETVIIAAGLAALAITVVAAITLLVNDKVAGISL
jgi:hypothetical protein